MKILLYIVVLLSILTVTTIPGFAIVFFLALMVGLGYIIRLGQEPSKHAWGQLTGPTGPVPTSAYFQKSGWTPPKPN